MIGVGSLTEDEARCQLSLSASVPVDGIFFPDAVTSEDTKRGSIPTTGSFDHGDTNESIMAAEALSETLHVAAHPNVSLYNPGERAAREKREEFGSKGASAFGVLGIWTGEDERFAYVSACASFERGYVLIIETGSLENGRDDHFAELRSRALASTQP